MSIRRAGALPPSRLSLILAWAGLYTLIATLSIFKVSNDDIWIHLKTGEQIVRTGHVPQKDVYSFTANDRDYVAHEWLAAVVFYGVYAAAGLTGLVLFKHAIVLATCIVLYFIARLRGDPLGLWAPALMLMLFLASARFLERPHIFSFLFTALYLLVHSAYRDGGRRNALYVIPALHVLWANLHGGHYVGIFLLAALAAAEAATALRARVLGALADTRPPLPGLELAKLGALPLACLASALVNPYGLRLLTFPFELTSLGIFMRGELGIVEWQTVLHPVYTSTAMYFFFVPWVGLVLAALAVSGGEAKVPSQWNPPLRALQFGTTVLAIVFVYELARTYRNPETPTALEAHAILWCLVAALWVTARLHRLDLMDTAIAALFLTLAFQHNRAVTDAAIATLPIVARGLSRTWDRFARSSIPTALLPANGILAAALAAITAMGGYHLGFDPPVVRADGLGIADNLPTMAVEYLQRNHVTGRVLNSYDAGGMLIQRLWPAVHVAMDSRNDVYGEALYREYREAFEGGPALDRYLQKWGIDIVVVTNNVPPPFPFLYYFETSDAWAMVHMDPRTFVYVRRNERFRDLIARDEPPLLNPGAAIPPGPHPSVR
jgi:hypothetical protein